MKRIAVFVDAGYFWVQVCQLLSGSYASRSQVSLDYASLHKHLLAEISNQLPDGDLLRVYWYDGPGTSGKTAEHHSIDHLDDFKLRLGTRNGVGQQKGVDGLIIADLISLTQQKSITHATLVTGDADITPGVIAAQSMGLRVHLLSLGAAAATSPVLSAEVDLKRAWGIAEVQKFASLAAGAILATNAAALPLVTAPSFIAIAQQAVQELKTSPHSAALAGLTKSVSTLPKEIDGYLLSVGRTAFARTLDETEKRQLRREFRKLL